MLIGISCWLPKNSSRRNWEDMMQEGSTLEGLLPCTLFSLCYKDPNFKDHKIFCLSNNNGKILTTDVIRKASICYILKHKNLFSWKRYPCHRPTKDDSVVMYSRMTKLHPGDWSTSMKPQIIIEFSASFLADAATQMTEIQNGTI